LARDSKSEQESRIKDKTAKLPLLDYERIASTIYSVLAAEKGDIHKACLFFGIAGTAILKQYYNKKEAKVVAGAALYRVGAGSNDVLALAQPTVDGFSSSGDGFHCWVEVDGGRVLDFQAPLFPEMLQEAGRRIACPRRMFQRSLVDQATSPEQLRKPGDFLYLPNYELTESLLVGFRQRLAYTDLVGIMANWFRKPPKRMQGAIGVANARGEVKEVLLRRLELSGAW
jgi:hypothetical protein